MAELTAEEIRANTEQAVEAGKGMENGLLIHRVHNGHIVETYREVRIYAPRKRPDQEKTK